MTEYEKAMLKLKLLELTQRQTLIAIAARECAHPEADAQADRGKVALDAAVATIGKLL